MGKKFKSGARERDESAVQRALRESALANRAAWARRHPKIAAAERALRKQNAATIDNWKHKNQGTPETHEKASRYNQGAFARLQKKGVIDSEQLASAEEIAAVHQRIVSGVTVKTASLETRVDSSRFGDGSFFEKLGHVRRELAYTEWRQRLAEPAPVLAMIVDGIGFTVAARTYRMGNGRALRLLIDALDLWPELLGPICKSVDQKALDAQHARLAA